MIVTYKITRIKPEVVTQRTKLAMIVSLKSKTFVEARALAQAYLKAKSDKVADSYLIYIDHELFDIEGGE
jgi:hypothetical protein